MSKNNSKKYWICYVKGSFIFQVIDNKDTLRYVYSSIGQKGIFPNNIEVVEEAMQALALVIKPSNSDTLPERIKNSIHFGITSIIEVNKEEYECFFKNKNNDIRTEENA